MEINSENEILILDFDHTLFLSNSTEEYLDSAAPKTLCSLFLALLDWIKIWNLFPGEQKRVVYRDAIRVILITIFFPWTYLIYRSRIASLLKESLNSDILNLALSKPWRKIIIASNGFDFILKPLLGQMNIQIDYVLCSQLISIKKGIRATGKQAYLHGILTENEFGKSVFISDNPEDKDLQGVVNQFFLYENTNAKRFSAGQNEYIPFAYTHQSKRGNVNHLLNVILLNDYSIFLLAYLNFSSISLQLSISLLFFVLSFWCIYEACYFENDLYELRNESKHKNIALMEYVEKIQDFPLERNAWIWGIGFGSLGLLFLESESLVLDTHFFSDFLLKCIVWVIWLVSMRMVFRIYTHSSFQNRIVSYPVLQIFRLAGPALFLPIDIYGIYLIISQMLNRWFNYLVYRSDGDPKIVYYGLVRHIVFVVLVSALAVEKNDIGILASPQFLVILSWSILRGNLKRIIVGDAS